MALGPFDRAPDYESDHEWFGLLEEQYRIRQAKLEELRNGIRKGQDSGPSQTWNVDAIKMKARLIQAPKIVHE